MEQKYIESMSLVHSRFEQFLRKFNKASKIEGIDYFLIGGGAIGALREGSFLPWDDDLDIIIKEEDVEKFKKINWEKYGWTLNNPDRKKEVPFLKLFLLDTKIKTGIKEDYLFIDVFTGYKQRKMGKIKRARMKMIDYIMYIRYLSYKEIKYEYNNIFTIIKMIFSLIPLTNNFLANHFNKIIEKSRIISNDKRKLYWGDDRNPKYWENYVLLRGDDYGFINGIKVPVPLDFRGTSRLVFGDIMIAPEKLPQKPDHGIEILKQDY